MKKTLLLGLIALFTFTLEARAHCQIPCGIFDDEKTFVALMEHATTIQKSMTEINRISAEEKPDFHTITRWTMNKEDHAQKIQDTAAEYFLAQRVKLPPEDASAEDIETYTTHTTLLHNLIVKAMKTKHTTNKDDVEKLFDAIEAYKVHYLGPHEHKSE